MTKSIIRVGRRIGVFIALTLAVAAFIYLCFVTILEQSQRLRSRTVSERQFSIGAEWWEHDLRAIRNFETRHGLNPESRDGLRFAIDEWPAWKYVISIEALQNGTAKGAIHAVAYNGKGPTYERDFQLEKGEARLLFDSFDHQINGYWGAVSQCTDGTSFQFERWSNKHVSSGTGNAACQRHYAELMSLVAETLVVQLNDVPFDWRSWVSAKRQLILHGKGD